MLTYMTPTAGPVKLAKVGGGDAAIFDYARSGPHFGADGLIIGKSQAATTGLFAGIARATAATGYYFSGFFCVCALIPANKPNKIGM